MKNDNIKATTRNTELKKNLTKRLKTIEGQVRGVSKMIDEDRYCNDILIQISAINKSLKSLGNEILKNHLLNCVTNDMKNDHLEIIDEVMEIIRRFD